MILGHILGKITTNDFKFLAKEEPNNFEYVQVYHKVYDFVLCQIVQVVKDSEKTVAHCQVIGYKDKGRIKRPRIPFDPQSEVLRADDEFISKIISLPDAKDNSYYATIGQLEGRDIPISVDLNKILTKHIAVLAKSGAGKSYSVGVLLEEIIERKVPLLVIDPHGEYSSLANPNENESDKELMAKFNVTSQGFNVNEYADTNINALAKPLRLPIKLTAQEFTHLLPGKITANQQAILYSALKNLKEVTFDSLLYELEAEESPAKYNIITTIEYLRSLPFFSINPTPYSELIKPGVGSIINLRGISPDVQEIIVYKLVKDLFSLRKKGKISPFFLVVEEAHNFCPERSFGETKASKILRDIASEGRKFGLGLCVVSQRPARVDKSVLSQCSTQIILKVTNPNDLKAISSSVEGITSESEKEIKNLPIGNALLTGVTEVPLFVTIRPRKSLHGGTAVDILNSASENQPSLSNKIQEFEDNEVLALIKPSMNASDVALMHDTGANITTVLVPAYQFVCRDDEHSYKVLVDMQSGGIIVDKDNFTVKHLPSLDTLTPRQMQILQTVFQKGSLSVQDLAAHFGNPLTFSEELQPLYKDEYIASSDSSVKMSDKYIFTRLHKVANFDTIAYESLAYHKKHVPSFGVDDVKNILAKFTTVEDQFECFVVKYDVV